MHRKRTDWLILAAAAAFLIAALWMTQISPWIAAQTAPGQRHGAVWRGTTPGIDVGVDAVPATRSRDGYLQVWIYPHQAEEPWMLVRVPGHRADWLGRDGRPL
jgi:hypothetical protein